jgi:uridine phosphorylase
MRVCPVPWSVTSTPRIRGTFRDAVSYLWVELLADSSLWTPAQSNGVYTLDLPALLTGASALGLRAGCLAGVIVSRASTEKIRKSDVARAEDNTIAVLKKSIRGLLNLSE